MSASHFLVPLLLLSFSLSFPTAISITGTTNNCNPLSPKASLLRYWSRKIHNSAPKPSFLLSKASPLSAPDAALYERLLSSSLLLPSRLRQFCAAAHLLCFPDISPELDSKGKSGSFASYHNTNFSNYGTHLTGGLDSFRNYSGSKNNDNNSTFAVDTFRRYSRASQDHDDRFAVYGPDGGADSVTANFTSYATSASGGSGVFTSYSRSVTFPEVEFSNYEAAASGGRSRSFASYSDGAIVGDQSFAGYGKGAVGEVPVAFTTYSKDSKVITSSFSGYGETAASPNDTFTTYGADGIIPQNKFKSYADGAKGDDTAEGFAAYHGGNSIGDDTFQSYGKGTEGSSEVGFSNYGNQSKVSTESFSGYGEAAVSPNDTFASYSPGGIIQTNKFETYAEGAEGDAVKESFSAYSDNAITGGNSFQSYGKGAKGGSAAGFASYGQSANTGTNDFSGYSAAAGSSNDTFASYGAKGNNPQNNFRNYADSAEGDVGESFKAYRDGSDWGADTFDSYGKGTEKTRLGFTRYGRTDEARGADTFSGYAKDATDPTVRFKTYFANTTFKGYNRSPGATVAFADYRNDSSSAANTAGVRERARTSGSRDVDRWVEPGKFFRESMLKEGMVMPMPDIRDKMPDRAFLPRSIASRIPFSTARLDELNRAFNATLGTRLAKAMADTVAECERKPSRGETKRCATSIEDMIDFATEVLGNDVVVRTTDSTKGSGGDVMIGKVHGINGGRVTKSVSCHQSLFPYMVFYCHSVPKVRVYQAEILAVRSKEVINHGVAICHLDTSDWSEGHGAFVSLGPGPGKIEVCHWIFQGDMTWAAAD